MKIKLGINAIFKYLYVVAIMLIIVVSYYSYGFVKENIYAAINPGDSLSLHTNRKSSEDLNVKKFDEVITKIKAKKNSDIIFIEKNFFFSDLASSSNDF